MQKSRNPPAQWFWKPQEEILGSQLVVRVGGKFTWPAPQLESSTIDRLVLVAGGVGIKYNCLSAILTYSTMLTSR